MGFAGLQSIRPTRCSRLRVWAALVPAVANLVLALPPRVVQAINREWTFQYYPAESPDLAPAAPDFDDASWPAVALPHTWSTYETTGELHPFIRNPQEKSAPYWWNGWGWYRKHFVIDAAQAGRKVFVEFDGVQKYCEVWLNGALVGEHKGGFQSFSLDLTGQVRFGADNVLAVAVSNRQADRFRIPVMDAGNWDLYGGIYRPVRLVLTDRLHVPFQGSAEHEGGTFITTPKVTTAAAEVRVRTWVKNDHLEPCDAELLTTIQAADGTVALTQRTRQRIAPGAVAEFDETSPLARPRRWSPGSPHLYAAISELRCRGEIRDRFESSFGVRSLRWQFAEKTGDNVLFVNEAPVDLQGFVRHQEYPWVGDAMPVWMHEMDLRDLQEKLNCNFFRSGHYTTDRAVYDFCDRQGLLVVEDVPNVKDKNFAREVQEQQVREMIRRDRNRPAIFAWCMGDESNRAADSRWAREEDPTRYIHARDCAPPAPGDFIDLPAKNLRLGRLMSCTVRGWYDRDEWSFEPANHQSTSHEERQHRAALEARSAEGRIDQRNLIVWLYEDHGCARTYQNAPLLNINPKGWVDLYRFPKYAYYLWQANHAAAPMVFVHPHFWRPRYVGQKRDFIVDSNCDTVELRVNGRSFGVLRPGLENFHVVTFRDIPVQPGTLSVVGVKNGQTVETRVVLAGEPARLVLTATHDKLEAALDTVAIIKADIVDAAGTHVIGATHPLHWSIEGPATLVGPPVYESDRAKNMGLEGTMYIDAPVANVIRSSGVPGLVTVQVQAAGLALGEVTLRFGEATPDVGGPIQQPRLRPGPRARVKRTLPPAPLVFSPRAPIVLPPLPVPAGAAESAYVRELSAALAPALEGADPGSPEFAALLRVLARQLSLNGGKLGAPDYAFAQERYARAAELGRYLAASPWPARFQRDLREYYSDEIVMRGTPRSLATERPRWVGFPATATLVRAEAAGEASRAVDLRDLVAQVCPAFRAAPAAVQDVALERIGQANPLVRRTAMTVGDRKTNDQQRVVSYTVPAGRALLVPSEAWLLDAR